MARPVEYMRADAARNVHRIVAVAARLLGENPAAGMADVAAAAGVSRATVYRHFPTREVLITAIHAQAFEHAEQALAACRLDEGTATEALRRLCAAWLDLAERYAFAQLASSPTAGRPRAPPPRARRAAARAVRARPGRGEFTTALARVGRARLRRAPAGRRARGRRRHAHPRRGRPTSCSAP